jgi:hypothetical protein
MFGAVAKDYPLATTRRKARPRDKGRVVGQIQVGLHLYLYLQEHMCAVHRVGTGNQQCSLELFAHFCSSYQSQRCTSHPGCILT